jgi:hypothetical protein
MYRNLHAEPSRWVIAGGNGCLWDANLLLDKGGDLDEERSCEAGNVLTGYEAKCSRAEQGVGEVAHECTGLEMEVAHHTIGGQQSE